MRRHVAEKIIIGMKRIDQIVGELDVVSRDIDDEDQKKKKRRALATLVPIYIDEVVRQFPDLHPDKQ